MVSATKGPGVVPAGLSVARPAEGPSPAEMQLAQLQMHYGNAVDTTNPANLDKNVKLFEGELLKLSAGDVSTVLRVLESQGLLGPAADGLRARLQGRLKDLISQTSTYTVKPDETLEKIAKRIGVRTDDLRALNPELPNKGDVLIANVTKLRLPKSNAMALTARSGSTIGRGPPQQLAPDDPLRLQYAAARDEAKSDAVLRGMITVYRSDARHPAGTSPSLRKELNESGAQRMLQSLSTMPKEQQKAVLERLITAMRPPLDFSRAEALGIGGWDSKAGNKLHDACTALGIQVWWQKQTL